MLIFRPYAGKLADKGIIKRPSVAGIICIAVSMFQFSSLGAGSSVWLIVAGMIMRGFGMSLLVSPVSTALLNSVTEAQTPTATSVNSLLQQVGGSVGIAISGILHVHISDYFMNAGKIVTVAEHLALQWGFIVSGVVVMLALIPAIKLPDHNKKEIDVRELGMHVEGR
jgi:MFS transporter, DHA2 family, multidrug resistance protein